VSHDHAAADMTFAAACWPDLSRVERRVLERLLLGEDIEQCAQHFWRRAQHGEAAHRAHLPQDRRPEPSGTAAAEPAAAGYGCAMRGAHVKEALLLVGSRMLIGRQD